MAGKYARMFVRGRYLFREANSFLRALLVELRGRDYVQGQISEHIFAPNGGYCVYYTSNLFRNERTFENWGIPVALSGYGSIAHEAKPNGLLTRGP